MRKLFSSFTLIFFAIALAAIALSGCSLPFVAGEPTPTPPPPEPTPLPAATPTPILPGATGTLQRALERRSLVVGWQTEAGAPFIQVEEDGSITGLDVLLADAFARRWLDRPNALAWKADATIQDLIDGQVDLLMGGLPHTRAAETEIDFSQTYWLLDDVPVAVGVASEDSLIRDLVNATLQSMVEDGSWEDIVQASGAFPAFTPKRWPGDIPAADKLAASSQAPEASRLRPNTPLRISMLNAVGFVNDTGSEEHSGYLPDLARELNRRLTGTEQVTLFVLDGPPPLSFSTFDLYLGPQVHDWSLEHQADFSQIFYGDGLAVVARPGSKVAGVDQLHNRPVALVESADSLALYEAAIAEAGVTPILFSVSDAEAAAALLEDNKVDAVLLRGYPEARLLAARVPDATLAPGRYGPTLPMAIVQPANDSALRDAVNLALQDMLIDGVLADLHSLHFGGDPPYPIETWPLR